ncbi:polysaccharide pyruvyl transferase family protein [Rhodoligotrophos ferricapiens]|uniref:polysaccharide pyruvyl transferase family protein n=1 Tax=Rhodoligotrophos ferricapiens TaxID=3069264 RepID=UPI00315CA0A0
MFGGGDIELPNTHRLLRTIVPEVVPAPVTQRYQEPRGVIRSLTKAISVPVQILSMLSRIALWRARIPSMLCRSLAAIRSADALVCKGGSLLYCDQSVRGHFFLFRMLCPIAAAILLKRPSFIFGQSIGPFRTPLSRSLMRAIGKRMSCIYVRDELSLEHLRELGIPAGKLRLIPDPAFLLTRYASREARDPSRPMLGVTALNVTRDQEAQSQYERKIATVISTFLDRHPGWSIRFLPQVIGPDPWQDDRIVQRRIASLVPEKYRESISIEEEDYTPLELCTRYSAVDLLLASRLHSSIFASVVSTPAVVLEYQQAKAKGAFTWLGRPDDVMPWQTDAKVISQALDYKVAHLESERAQLDATVEKLANALQWELQGIVAQFAFAK